MATYSTPIPGVPQYGQAALAAKTAYQNTLARINQRRQALLRQGGFEGEIDGETGVLKNMRVDGSSRYGALQQLNRAQAMRDESARWQGIERGLGSGGGLAAQLRNQERFEFGQEDANLAQSLLESLSGLQDEQNQAAYSRDAALYQAELGAARHAIQNEAFNPADFTGLEYPAPGTDPLTQPPGTSVKPAAKKPVITNHRQLELAATKAARAAEEQSRRKAEAALAARSKALNKKYKLGGRR